MYESIPEEIQECSDIIPMPKMPDATIDPATIEAGFTVYGFMINKAPMKILKSMMLFLKVCDMLASDELSQSLQRVG